MHSNVAIRGFIVSCDSHGSVSITTGDKLDAEGILVDYNNPTYLEVISIIRYYEAMSLCELAKCVKEWV